MEESLEFQHLILDIYSLQVSLRRSELQKKTLAVAFENKVYLIEYYNVKKKTLTASKKTPSVNTP